jgi:hypothetical protein
MFMQIEVSSHRFSFNIKGFPALYLITCASAEQTENIVQMSRNFPLRANSGDLQSLEEKLGMSICFSRDQHFHIGDNLHRADPQCCEKWAVLEA